MEYKIIASLDKISSDRKGYRNWRERLKNALDQVDIDLREVVEALEKIKLEKVEKEEWEEKEEEVKGEVLRHNPPPPPKSRKKKPRHTGHADADPQMIEARAVYEQTNERMAEIIDEIDGYDIVYRLLTKDDVNTLKAQRISRN